MATSKKRQGKSRKEGRKEKKKKDRQNKQLKTILMIMALVIFAVLAVYFLINSLNNFEFIGLNFEKVNIGKILFYYTKIPITNAQGETVANFNLYLRNDPRNQDVPLNAKIILKRNLIVSVDPDAETGCEDNGIAGANFFGFLKAAGFEVKLAYTNETYAKERNALYTTCYENYGPEMDNIIIQKSNVTGIFKQNQNCYVIEFKDCEILEATERFIIATIAHSKGIEI